MLLESEYKLHTASSGPANETERTELYRNEQNQHLAHLYANVLSMVHCVQAHLQCTVYCTP